MTPRLIERLRVRVEAICQELLDAMERKKDWKNYRWNS